MDLDLLAGNYFDGVNDAQYYYLVGTSGLLLLNKDTMEQVAYFTATNLTCVWTDATVPFVYLGTSNSGVLQATKPVHLGNLSGIFYNFLSYPVLPANHVYSLHGQDLENYIVGTASGVAVSSKAHLYKATTPNPVLSVVLTSRLDVYYAGQFGVYNQPAPIIADWTQPTNSFTTTSVPPLQTVPVVDLDVTYDEALNPVIAAATASGVTIFRQRPIFKSSSTLYLVRPS